MLYNEVYFHMVRQGLRMGADDELTKDCINQLFLKLWERREALKPVSDVKGYLMTAFHHLVIDELNYRKKLSQAIDRFASEEPQNERPYEEILIRGQHTEAMRKRLKNALAQLTPKQLELIQLKFFENRTYEEIAESQQVTVKTAYNTIYDAVKRLRKIIAPYFF